MSSTPTAVRSRVRSIAIMAGAVVVLSVGISAVAIAAIGGSGQFKLCVKASNVRAISSGGTCASGETTLQVYTKGGADTKFLTKTGKAANADKLDGKDSTAFVRTNCIGYPHNEIDWHGCDLNGANISHQGLSGADLSGANLLGALADGVNFVATHLENANLQHVEFIDADLENAHMDGADLTEANLKDAVMEGAELPGATLTGVNWDNTTCPDGTNSDDDGGTCEGHLT
jgi:Pentapeptide repeats (8 copies)